MPSGGLLPREGPLDSCFLGSGLVGGKILVPGCWDTWVLFWFCLQLLYDPVRSALCVWASFL